MAIVPGTVAPGLLPDLFPGRSGHGGRALAGASRRDGHGDRHRADGTPFESTVTAVTGGNPASTAAWARAHLRDLEDRYACLPGHDTAELARLEQQITGVSLRYGVLCRFTAFVAAIPGSSRTVRDRTG